MAPTIHAMFNIAMILLLLIVAAAGILRDGVSYGSIVTILVLIALGYAARWAFSPAGAPWVQAVKDDIRQFWVTKVKPGGWKSVCFCGLTSVIIGFISMLWPFGWTTIGLMLIVGGAIAALVGFLNHYHAWGPIGLWVRNDLAPVAKVIAGEVLQWVAALFKSLTEALKGAHGPLARGIAAAPVAWLLLVLVSMGIDAALSTMDLSWWTRGGLKTLGWVTKMLAASWGWLFYIPLIAFVCVFAGLYGWWIDTPEAKKARKEAANAKALKEAEAAKHKFELALKKLETEAKAVVATAEAAAMREQVALLTALIATGTATEAQINAILKVKTGRPARPAPP